MNPHRKLPSHWIIPFMGLSISIFMILIWLIGPVQNQAKQEEYILRSVISKSAFKNCVVVETNSFTPNARLVECDINEDHVVWLEVNEQGNVLNRLNWIKEELLVQQLDIQNQYPNALIHFNFYQDTFVWEINDLNQDLLIDLNTKAIVLKVRH